MKLRMRLRLGTLMVAVAVLTVLSYLVVLPLWQYYSLPAADRAIVDALERRADMPFAHGATLSDVLKFIKAHSTPASSIGAALPSGIPIYVEPYALEAMQVDMNAPVRISTKGARMKTSLVEALKQLGLVYRIKDGVLIITSENVVEFQLALEAKEKAIKVQEAIEAKQAGQ